MGVTLTCDKAFKPTATRLKTNLRRCTADVWFGFTFVKMDSDSDPETDADVITISNGPTIMDVITIKPHGEGTSVLIQGQGLRHIAKAINSYMEEKQKGKKQCLNQSSVVAYKLSDKFGQYTIFLKCPCSHTRLCGPKVFANISDGDANLADVVKRLRCSKCDEKQVSYTVAPPSPYDKIG